MLCEGVTKAVLRKKVLHEIGTKVLSRLRNTMKGSVRQCYRICGSISVWTMQCYSVWTMQCFARVTRQSQRCRVIGGRRDGVIVELHERGDRKSMHCYINQCLVI